MACAGPTGPHPPDRVIAQARPPARFRWLLGATVVSTLGDGVYVAALPLLAASMTSDPMGIAVVVASPYLAWAALGLVTGVLVDRYPRPVLMMTADVIRCVALSAAVLMLVSGTLTIALLIAVGIVLGVGQTVFDTASQATIPQLVDTRSGGLEQANSRMVAVQTTNTEFIGPPLGAAIFSWLPPAAFLVNAVSFLFSALLVLPLRRERQAVAVAPAAARGLFVEIAAGVRFLLGHRLLRKLTVTTVVVNLSYTAGETLLVLYAGERLGLGSLGFGLLFAPLAAGGIAGALIAPAITRRLKPGPAILLSLAALTSALLTLAFAGTVWLAGGALAVSGGSIAVYNVLGQSLRQAVTPSHILGRVISAFRMVALGAIPIGAVLGGLLARVDIAAPYAAGAGLLLLTTIVLVPTLTQDLPAHSVRAPV